MDEAENGGVPDIENDELPVDGDAVDAVVSGERMRGNKTARVVCVVTGGLRRARRTLRHPRLGHPTADGYQWMRLC